MKTIWLINQYASTPETGIGGRHHHLARELARLGRKVYLIAARHHHVLMDQAASDGAPLVENLDGYNFVRLNTVKYNDAHDKRRALGWFVFAWRVARLGKNPALAKPDVILHSSPSLFAYLGAERLARRFSCRLIFEERDLWPLSLIEFGGKSKRHPLLRFMQWIEDRTYRVADATVSNLPNAVEHMHSRGLDPAKFTWVANGFSLDEMKHNEPLPPSWLDDFPKNKFIVGYAGTLGLANSLDTLVDAAEQLQNRDDIAFVIVGNGREKQHLQARVAEKGLKSVHFLPRVSKIQVQSVLKQYNVCFIALKKVPLLRFGIAANKIFDYLYSAKPILHCYSGAKDPVAEYGCGISVEAEDPDALARAVVQLADLPSADRQKMGDRGRAAALEHHEYAHLAKKLEAVLLPPGD